MVTLFAMESIETPLFEILTPLDVLVRTTPSYWAKITTSKHPIMSGQEELVQQTLQTPVEIRQSSSDLAVYLYYKPSPPYFICVVAKHLNGEGYIVTAYRTDRIKRGVCVWMA